MTACNQPSAHRLAVRNPRTGERDYFFDLADKKTIAGLAQHLRRAQLPWSDLSVRERCDLLLQWARRISAESDALCAALSEDTGRTRESWLEIDGVISIIQRWCDSAEQMLAEVETKACSMPGMFFSNALVPYPLVGVISPWNLPLLLSLIDAIPALLCGCAVMIKPSEVTPRFIEPLVATLRGLPQLADVVCLLPGDADTGAELINHVDTVVFTGSVATGKKVAAVAAQRLMPAYLELGGKDPAIVMANADIDHAAAAITWGALTNGGQACQAIERIYVQREVYREFVDKLVANVSSLQLNSEDASRGHIGPVIAEQQLHVLQRHLTDARIQGADVLCGGEFKTFNGGVWCEPTVLVNVDHQMLVMTEESFGPLLPVMPFDSLEEAVSLANDSEYGLSAAVFAETSKEATDIARRLSVGAVSINDCSLTAFIHEAEKQAFNASGLGESRMGENSIYRFLRKKAHLVNSDKRWQPWWYQHAD